MKQGGVITLWACIQDVSGSNPCWGTRYPAWNILWFSSICPCNCQNCLKYTHFKIRTSLSFHILKFSTTFTVEAVPHNLTHDLIGQDLHYEVCIYQGDLEDPCFCGTKRFFGMYATTCDWSMSSVNWIQSVPYPLLLQIYFGIVIPFAFCFLKCPVISQAFFTKVLCALSFFHACYMFHSLNFSSFSHPDIFMN